MFSPPLVLSGGIAVSSFRPLTLFARIGVPRAASARVGQWNGVRPRYPQNIAFSKLTLPQKRKYICTGPFGLPPMGRFCAAHEQPCGVTVLAENRSVRCSN